MYNKKWKKLSKRFACALALAMLMSVNPAWSWSIGEDNTINFDKTLDSPSGTYNGQALNEFTNINVDVSNQSGIDSSGQFNLSESNMVIRVIGGDDNDGIRLGWSDAHLKVNDLSIFLSADNANALNMTHDASGGAYTEIGSNLYVEVSGGDGTNGIRANGSRVDNSETKITVDGTTTIIADIEPRYVFVKVSDAAAVYAGNSASRNNDPWGNRDTKGHGIIELNGMTKIKASGDGNHAIYAGKNGSIFVNNSLDIQSEGKDSYGIAVRNGNISYAGLAGLLDPGANTFGSRVVLKGQENIISMNGGGWALYASGTDAGGKSNGIFSGDKDGGGTIGSLKATGDITAEDGGAIKLKLKNYLNVTGTLSAFDGGEVSIVYGEGTDGDRNKITGGLVADGGTMSITGADSMTLTGSAFAVNDGELTVSLGSGSVWAGRVDDYQDAANSEWVDKHDELFETPISSISSNGAVNVTLGSGATWELTGQSWVTNLNGNGAVDLTGGLHEGHGYAIHVRDLYGSNKFIVNLYQDEEAKKGNMIYINGGVSTPQEIVIANRSDVISSMKTGDRIRFATIGGDTPSAAFGRGTRISDAGMFNVDFAVAYEDYRDGANNDKHNDDHYNGAEMNTAKPSTEYVDEVYGSKENAQNAYIVKQKPVTLSDAGRTVLNMSRANYAAAVYMDRLNKRMGEARYFAGEDEGIWARVRHDRVGKEDAYLVQNTMFEVGFDRKLESKNGTRRVGIAADYMEGDTEYNNIAGKGEIDRFGLWLYSTWFGEKGHYTDYVLKWGRMSNEFDIYAMTTGERITGDYDNNVFSASAEYGRRIELGKGWFFEPQAQVQFARITEADYVTSQGTRVEADGINSLIARAGFRLGREFGGKSQGSVYVKADVLHEFLGDQDVHALDGTTDNRWYTVGYDNDGTWYDVGLGLSCRTGKNSFVFLDLEHSFGNDNDDSYQISAGVQWSF